MLDALCRVTCAWQRCSIFRRIRLAASPRRCGRTFLGPRGEGGQLMAQHAQDASFKVALPDAVSMPGLEAYGLRLVEPSSENFFLV